MARVTNLGRPETNSMVDSVIVTVITGITNNMSHKRHGRARKVKVNTDIVTVVKGQEEARSTVQTGGWIIRNPGYNTPDEFVERYEAYPN